ncbi:zinc-dependent metalloprotease [Rhodoferax sp.]|uniref:zinc-dependent metalloprotease n=1 Tax=Rhodoferax sp. TaxID=50421 RepID=UPI0025FD59A9|nr:zinc-dependent metalloprotease [Rhodoferax sp.]
MTTLLLRISLPLVFLLASCTTTTKVAQAVNEAQAAANVATTAAIVAQSAASAPRAPGAPPSPLPLFATVLQGTQRSIGLFPVYQRDERFWLELGPDDFGKPFFLSPKMASGIGEGGLFGGRMLAPRLVEFRRVHNLVQLVARNTDFVAPPGTPEARAVAAAYAPSLLGSTPVASQPHPNRQSVLVDAGALFINDMGGVAQALAQTYRQNYGVDMRNSAILKVRGTPDLLVLEVMNHYATASIALPMPGMSMPGTPNNLVDPRSMFIQINYSLARLPAQTMAPRLADPRIGHFVEAVDNFGDDLAPTARQRFIARWRLDKQDPLADLAEPVKPITYWIDRSVPLKYREAIRAGILAWNPAFERIGFKDAIRVQQQPDDADFDTLDFGRASVRWSTNNSTGFAAIGPRHVDPRSGEILDADIRIESQSVRATRASATRRLGLPVAETTAHALPESGQDCDIGAEAGEQLAYALDLLASQGDIAPDSPEAEQFVRDYITSLTIHEVGHTLGLRHNFRASRLFTQVQLANPAFTRAQGLGGSVMDYLPVNLGLPGQPRPAAFQTTLGPYDYWAIDYAYRPIPPAVEAATLAQIASRSAEPALAYGTDEDFSLGADPETLQRDLGDNPVAFARQRFAIAHSVFQRLETLQPRPDQDWSSVRRLLRESLNDTGSATGILLRQLGGVRMLRDFANTGRDPAQPTPAADQRAALDLLLHEVLAANRFAISPALQRRLVPDYLARAEAPASAGDLPLAREVFGLRLLVLNSLMGDALAGKLLDNDSRLAPLEDALRLPELVRRVEAEVWTDLNAPTIAPSAEQRELQHAYTERLAALVLRPAGATRADARSIVRGQATALLARITSAQQRRGNSAETRQHLADNALTLRNALSAKLVRAS